MSKNEETFAGVPHRRALELMAAGMRQERDDLDVQIRMIEDTLANGNPGYGHLPDVTSPGEAAPKKRTRGPRSCGNCGQQGHDSRVCPTSVPAPSPGVPPETV